MAGNEIELTDATFDQTIHNSDVPVLVDFWAPWCGPCKMIAPLIKEIADEYADRAKICRGWPGTEKVGRLNQQERPRRRN